MTTSAITSPPLASSAHKRPAAELVDAAIQLVRQHYPVLLTVSAIACLPLLLVTPCVTRIPSVVTGLLAVICYGYAEACLLLGVSMIYTGAPEPAPGALLREGRRYGGRVVSIGIVRNVATFIGFILLVVPAPFFYAHYALGAPAAVLEDLQVRPAIKRGAALAKGEYRRIIGIVALTGLIYFMLSFGLGMVLGALTASAAMSHLAITVLQILVTPVLVAVTVLVYYDVRERREGVDIEWALGSVGETAGPAGGAPAHEATARPALSSPPSMG